MEPMATNGSSRLNTRLFLVERKLHKVAIPYATGTIAIAPREYDLKVAIPAHTAPTTHHLPSRDFMPSVRYPAKKMAPRSCMAMAMLFWCGNAPDTPRRSDPSARKAG